MTEVPVEFSINDHVPPERFIYRHLRHKSGPLAGSGYDYDLNTDSVNGNSVFEYEVPEGETVDIARLNFIITGWGAIHPNNFAGIDDGLQNGCLLQVVDTNGADVLLDFCDGVPLRTNDQFAKLAGVDSVAVDSGNGDDWFPIRFTIQKAGKKMRLTSGQRIRWTNRDDLSSITRFQIMVQGVLIGT
jgi:hypothetical protein